MTTITPSSPVFEVDPKRRYWVVRADAGNFYTHFVEHGLVAVGFLDTISPAAISVEELPKKSGELLERLIKKLQSGEPKLSPPKIDAKVEQCRRFIDDMYVGDWVITVQDRFLRIGRIVSHAFIDPTQKHPLPSADGLEQPPMTFALRRKVTWGPEILRTGLPSIIRNALSAHLTIFSVDNYWQEIHHLLFPIFQVEDDLYFSLRLNSKEGINNYLVSQLLEYCSEVEACVRLEASQAQPSDAFEDQVFSLAQHNQLRLETKASYFSPGIIWGLLQDIGTSAAWVIPAYIAMFGNTKLGFDGIVDIKSKHKILDFVLKRWDSKRGPSITAGLVIDAPVADTKRLTDKSKDVTSAAIEAPARAKVARRKTLSASKK
jgi:hypothetical protein